MYDVIIIGAGPGGIFSAYELMKQDENLKIAVFDAGHSLEQRHCPIDGEKVKSCISCKTEPEPFRMVNTTSPMISAVRYMNISADRKHLN